MKKCLIFNILCLLAILSISCQKTQPETTFDYTLSWIPEGGLHVELTYRPILPDSSDFVYGDPSFGGQPDIFDHVVNIQGVENTYRVVPEKRLIRLYHPNGEPVSISYDLKNTPYRSMRTEMFRPIFTGQYISVNGSNLYLQPQFPEWDSIRQSSRWETLPPFPIYQTFDAGNLTGKRTENGYSIFYGSIVIGSDSLTVDPVRINGVDNYVVTAFRRNADYNRKEMVAYFKDFYQAINRFWDEKKPKAPYSLVVTPFLYSDWSTSGLGLVDSFSAKFSNKADTLMNDARYHLLSHEIGHHWIGGSAPEERWFGEGVHDFTSFYIPVWAGLKDVDYFLQNLNGLLAEHYADPHREVSNAEVLANYWDGPGYTSLLYKRGTIFAFHILNQLDLATDGKVIFRDLMLTLKPEIPVMDRERFARMASVYLDRDKLNGELDYHITQGKTVRFTPEMLSPVFTLSWEGDIPVIGKNPAYTDEQIFERIFREKQ